VRSAPATALDVEELRLRLRLRDRELAAWVGLVSMAVLDIVAVRCAMYAAVEGFIVLAALAFTALVLMTLRIARRVWRTRTSLRALARRGPSLPPAIVRRR
jgi:hypothetical protein